MTVLELCCFILKPIVYLKIQNVEGLCMKLLELCRAEELNNYSSEDKYYIVSMLFEGGFVHGFVIPKGRYHNFDIANIDGLTMKGHEMADNIHNETIWNNTKSKLKGAGRISLSIFSQIVGETAAAYSKKMMNLE